MSTTPCLHIYRENEGIIIANNEKHLWALHFVYLPRIKRDLGLFCNQWNHHLLRTARYISPYQIFVQGCLDTTVATSDWYPRYIWSSQFQGAAALAFDWLQRVVVPLNQFQASDEHLRQHTILWVEIETVWELIRSSMSCLKYSAHTHHLTVVITLSIGLGMSKQSQSRQCNKDEQTKYNFVCV